MNKGLWVLFEGADGSGKSSLCRGVHIELQKRGVFDTVITSEPGSPHSQACIGIRNLIKFNTSLNNITNLCLFIADRAQHMDEVVIPALQHNKIVLQDRGFVSSIIYQGFAQNESNRAYIANVIKTLNNLSMQFLEPDLIIEPHVSLDVAQKRISERRGTGGPSIDHFERREFQRRVTDAYAELALPNYHRLDGEKPIDELVTSVVELIYSAAKLTA